MWPGQLISRGVFVSKYRSPWGAAGVTQVNGGRQRRPGPLFTRLSNCLEMNPNEKR